MSCPYTGRFCHVNNVLRHLFGVEGEGFCLPVLQLSITQADSAQFRSRKCIWVKYASVVRGYLISRVKYWEQEKESFSLEGGRVKGVLKILIFKIFFLSYESSTCNSNPKCNAILDIFLSRAFQQYKKHLIWTMFVH